MIEDRRLLYSAYHTRSSLKEIPRHSSEQNCGPSSRGISEQRKQGNQHLKCVYDSQINTCIGSGHTNQAFYSAHVYGSRRFPLQNWSLEPDKGSKDKYHFTVNIILKSTPNFRLSGNLIFLREVIIVRTLQLLIEDGNLGTTVNHHCHFERSCENNFFTPPRPCWRSLTQIDKPSGVQLQANHLAHTGFDSAVGQNSFIIETW